MIKIFRLEDCIVVDPKGWSLPYAHVLCNQRLFGMFAPIPYEVDLRCTCVVCILDKFLQNCGVGRVASQDILITLCKDKKLHPVICIVVEPSQEEEYREVWPHVLMLVLPENGRGAGFARWVIQKTCTRAIVRPQQSRNSDVEFSSVSQEN